MSFIQTVQKITMCKKKKKNSGTLQNSAELNIVALSDTIV